MKKTAKARKRMGVSGAEIARKHSVTGMAVSKWRKMGCPVLADGTFDEAVVNQWLLQRERDKVKDSKPLDPLDRQRAARAKLLELELEKKKGDLVDAEDVRREVARLCSVVKDESRNFAEEIIRQLGLNGESVKIMAARDAFLRRCAAEMVREFREFREQGELSK